MPTLAQPVSLRPVADNEPGAQRYQHYCYEDNGDTSLEGWCILTGVRVHTEDVVAFQAGFDMKLFEN